MIITAFCPVTPKSVSPKMAGEAAIITTFAAKFSHVGQILAIPKSIPPMQRTDAGKTLSAKIGPPYTKQHSYLGAFMIACMDVAITTSHS